ncbi:MAG: hypothetical protein GF390_02980, partial [Candidatus Pacebacteria bacterium]|nr:hypothetical protein [Candidatus Paceibacterota bacterium]
MLQHQFTDLKSGLPIIQVPMPSVESLTILVLVNTGSRYEKPKSYGIAHFFEHIISKGTAAYPTAKDIAVAIDSVGASFNAYTSREYTGYYFTAAAKHLELGLDLLSDMLLKPKLRQKDIELEKQVIIEEINLYADTPQHHIANIFDQMMFKSSGLGHDITGTPRSVNSLTTADLKAFIRQWYGLGNMVVVLAGQDKIVKSKKTLDLVEKMFAKKIGVRPKDKISLKRFTSKNPIAPKRLQVVFRRTKQAHFVLGWPAPEREDERRYALVLLSVILGGNISSRLFQAVREQRGLCYYINSELDQYHDAGVLGASAGVDPERVKEALKVTVGEFNELASGNKPITD